MRLAPCLLASTLLLSGCMASKTETDGMPQRDTAEHGLPPSDSIYRGYLVMDEEMHVFVPCDSNDPLWLVADDDTGHRLESRYTSLVSEPDDEAFAVLRGKPGPQLSCESCRDFPGSFKVEEVIEFRRATAKDCH